MSQIIPYNTFVNKALGGFLIGRNGTVEVQMILTYLSNQRHNTTHQFYIERTGCFCKDDNPDMVRESIYSMCKQLILAINKCDVSVGPWYRPTLNAERELYNRHCSSNIQYIDLKDLEPYYAPPDRRWTVHLKGLRIGIISPFAETAFNQTKRRHLVWPKDTDTLLPDAKYIPIRTYFPPGVAGNRAGWPDDIHNWEHAIEYLERQCIGNIDIAIIGCGSIGMILGQRLKAWGIKCIVMGGATQCLFGIKGRRWVSNPTISRFWNDAWVSPSVDETPDGWETIENGCYWY